LTKSYYRQTLAESEDGIISGTSFKSDTVEDVVIVSILESSTAVDNKEFVRELQDFYERDFKNFIIDLTETRILQSATIGAILNLAQDVSSSGGLCIVSRSDRIRYVLDITRVSEAVSIYETTELALQSFKQSS